MTSKTINPTPIFKNNCRRNRAIGQDAGARQIHQRLMNGLRPTQDKPPATVLQTVPTAWSILATAQRTMNGTGVSAVGLSKILAEAKVPKGSFYHYFGPTEDFGKALLTRYFDTYLAAMFAQPGQTGAARIDAYWQNRLTTQSVEGPQIKCRVVKLAAFPTRRRCRWGSGFRLCPFDPGV